MAFSKYSKSCECKLHQKKIDEQQDLKNLLPAGYEYALCDFEGSRGTFTTRFRINLHTESEVKEWLKEFSLTSNTSYRVSKTYPDRGVKLVYKVQMHCHHNTHPKPNCKNPSGRHTNCPAKISLTVKNTKLSRKYKSKDVHLPHMPTLVCLQHDHNHRIDIANLVKHQTPNTENNELFLNYLHEGHTQSNASAKYLCSFTNENSEDSFSNENSDDYFTDENSEDCFTNESGEDYFTNENSGEDYFTKENGEDCFTNENCEDYFTNENGEDCFINENSEDCFTASSDRSICPDIQWISKLDNIFSSIKTKAEKNPGVLRAAQKFISLFDNICTDTELISALSTFGKYTGFLEKKELGSCKTIGVQSTVMAKRNIAESQCLQAVRPPKRPQSYLPEHEYNMDAAPKSTLLPSKKRKAANNLSYFVYENDSLKELFKK